MINNIKNFIRQADDMGMNAGDVHWGNRGVVWHRLNPGAFSKLPESMMNALAEQMKLFKSNYEQFAVNPKTGEAYSHFKGMLFTIYAEDRSISRDIENKIPPHLKQAADLVKKYEIKLPVSDEKAEKYIGGPQWISHYAYAWRDKFPNDVMFDENKSLPRSVLQMTSKVQEKYEHGPLVILPTTSGFGLFITTNKNNTVPIYIGQSPVGLTKYFDGNLSPNQSNVYMPDGPHGKVVPARFSKNTQNRTPEEIEMINNKEYLHRFIIQEDGSIGADFDGRFIPFNKEQISSIVPRLNTLWYIRPAVEKDGVTIDMGPWRMSDNLKEFLSDKTQPIGFEALKQLRLWLEGVKPGLHTPAEGFKIITIGPIFSNSLSLPVGETVGRSQFVTELTRSDHDRLAPGFYQKVKRGVQWVVLANEISDVRYQNSGTKIRPFNRAQGESERSPAYDSPQEAIMYVKSKYLSNSPNADQILNEMSESVAMADKALRAASEQDLNTTNTENRNNIQQNVTDVNNVPVNTVDKKEDQKNVFQKPRKTLDVSNYKDLYTSSVKKWLDLNGNK